MGFASPLALSLLSFAGLLVLLYLRRRRRRELEVSSLMLWQPVPNDTPRGRFRPNALFLLQFALLGGLAIAAARPYWTEHAATLTSERAILVFDTSASMQTLEGGERRFDQARRRAGTLLAHLDPEVEVMIIAVAAHPRVVVAFTRDRSSVSRALEGLEPDDGPTRLELGVQLAHTLSASAHGPLEIDVFTDVPRRQLAFVPTRGERLHYFRFGRTDDNVALAALRVRQNPFQDDGEGSAYALVRNYAGKSKDLELHVTLDSKPVLDQTVHLAARASRAFPIDRLPRAGRLEARLEVADALPLDNRAFAVVPPVRKIRVLAVSPSAAVLSDLRVLARGIPALEVRTVAPADFHRQDEARADVVVFHDFVPVGGAPVNALYVYPPPANPLFPSDRNVVAAQILDWNEADPVLHDLRYLEALPLERSRMVALPPWAHMLIASRANGREFPLAFRGEHDGRRVVCFAFDLQGRSLVRSENLSLLLLTLNALRWLTPPDPAVPVQVDVGDSFHELLPEAVAYRVTGPDGRTTVHAPTRRLEVEMTRAGVYRIRAGDERRTIYANLFDAEESDVGRTDPPGDEIVLGEGTAPSVSATRRHGFGRTLIGAGFLLALIEWAVWSWLERRRRTADVV